MEPTTDSALLWELQTSEAYRLPTKAEEDVHGRNVIRVHRQSYKILAEPIGPTQKVKIRGTPVFAEGEYLWQHIEEAGPFAGCMLPSG